MVTDDRGIAATTAQEVDVVETVAVRSFQLVPGWPARVVGEVENRSGYVLLSMTLQAKFYDADGVRLTDATTDITGIDPGERVRFSVPAEEYSSEISSASVVVQSFAADCPRGPYPVPVGDAARR